MQVGFGIKASVVSPVEIEGAFFRRWSDVAADGI
jgi:hypothetical protein